MSSRNLAFPVFAVVLTIASVWLLLKNEFRASSTTSAVQTGTAVAPQVRSTSDPCWFKNREAIMRSPELSAAFVKRTEREIRGYPADTTLSDALRVFNDEADCLSFRGNLPPLTEDEIIAAIVAGPVYGREETWLSQKDVLWKIASQRMMPKGTLLTAESGGCVYDSPLGRDEICVKGQRIYLFLELDKRPRQSQPLMPAQVFVLREKYFRIERSKPAQ
jgi:hypothetical protein